MTSGTPAAASSVGSMSSCAQISFETVPGLITPGQRISVGTRQPASQLVSFSPRNGDVPPSGQENSSAPLSVEYMTMVLSAMPSSSSLSSSRPTSPSCSTMPSGYVPEPGLADRLRLQVREDVHARRVRPDEERLARLVRPSMKSSAASVNSSLTVSMRLVVSGPVFSMRLLADAAKHRVLGRIVFVGGPAVHDAARAEALFEFGVLRIVGILGFFLGVQVVEVAEELIEAMASAGTRSCRRGGSCRTDR